MVSITGRAFPEPTYNAEVHNGGVILRIDDTRNPDQWVQVFIPWEDMTQWIADQVRRQGIQEAISLTLVDPPRES